MIYMIKVPGEETHRTSSNAKFAIALAYCMTGQKDIVLEKENFPSIIRDKKKNLMTNGILIVMAPENAIHPEYTEIRIESSDVYSIEKFLDEEYGISFRK